MYNTGWFFLSFFFPEHDSSHGIAWRMQAFCAMKVLCSGTQ